MASLSDIEHLLHSYFRDVRYVVHELQTMQRDIRAPTTTKRQLLDNTDRILSRLETMVKQVDTTTSDSIRHMDAVSLPPMSTLPTKHIGAAAEELIQFHSDHFHLKEIVTALYHRMIYERNHS